MTTKAEDFTETQYKAISGQISTNESQGIVECFVAAIGNKDSVGDICLPGCFDGSLKRRKPRVVWGHNWNEPIGKVLEVYEVGPQDPRLPAKMKTNGVGGLFARVQFNLKSERGREAFSNVQFFGEEQEWSIGYKTLDAVFDTSKQANMLKEVELYEVSPVLHGANQLTGTISIKADESLKSASIDSKNGPCWPGYRQEGMKKGKNGNMVPNCVPDIDSGEKSALKDPKGGLTAAGRAHFKRTEGANLKPGVRGPANTPTKMRRKGSFLTRFFTNPSGPMKDEKGRPTRLALSAAAWGEPVPQNAEDAAKLAAKGRRLLERYENSKEKSDFGHEATSEKNIQIYSIPDSSQNPIIGRMGSMAKALSSHFGGEVTIREADTNNVVFDIAKDGKSETMRVAYHTPNESDFMFGAAQPVKVETIYLPIDSNGKPAGAPVPSSPNMLTSFDVPKQSCGCGGACGGKSSPFEKWESFKNENPGIHLFIKTQNVEMYEVANEIADYHGFDVEMLEDGFVVPNIDWYDEDVRKALISAVESIEQKAFARAARSPLGAARRARRMVKPSSFDGDGDGMRTGPDGRDNIPYRKPKGPSMMPPRREPSEIPEREERPTVVPIRIPKPQREPARTPAPSRPNVPTPIKEPATPQRIPATTRGGISGAMRGAQLLRQLENLEQTAMGSSAPPRRAMNQALSIIAKRNDMTEEQVRKEIRRAVQRRRRIDAAKRLMRMQKSVSSVFMSIPENADIEVKSLLAKEPANVVIPVEQEFLFKVKQLIDPVAEHYSLNIKAVEEGIQIFSSDSLTDEAIEAASAALYSAFGQVRVEDSEIARALRLDWN
jgi:HK97 family phage prohead protease